MTKLILGIIIGFSLGLAFSAYAITMTTTVEKSEMRSCIEACGYTFK